MKLGFATLRDFDEGEVDAKDANAVFRGMSNIGYAAHRAAAIDLALERDRQETQASQEQAQQREKILARLDALARSKEKVVAQFDREQAELQALLEAGNSHATNGHADSGV